MNCETVGNCAVVKTKERTEVRLESWRGGTVCPPGSPSPVTVPRPSGVVTTMPTLSDQQVLNPHHSLPQLTSGQDNKSARAGSMFSLEVARFLPVKLAISLICRDSVCKIGYEFILEHVLFASIMIEFNSH